MDFYRMPIIGPTADWFLALYLLLPPVMGCAWVWDHSVQRNEAIKWQCKFELIDPIRWEAGEPMSECCK